MPRIPRKTLALVITGAIVLAGGGAAFGYWTAGGFGTGTATAGTSVPITVNQTNTVTGLQPGAAAQVLSGKFSNTNTGPVYVATVTASIASVFKSGVAAVGCDASDFTLASAVMTVAAEVPAGASSGAWSGATIAFNDKPTTNQDACKGVTVNFAYTAA